MTQVQPTSIEGIYEVCIGTQDALSQIQYWQQFGYRIGQMGELSATAANQLYSVNSALHSIRLYHQDADHGLIRLMVWENPTNEGLQMSSMKGKGNRWATALTADLLTILNHAQEATAAGLPVNYTHLHWEIIYNKERKSRPFLETAVGVREMMLLQPLTRQVLFQRFGYSLPNYGQINESAFFKTSQITHMGMVIQDDSKETLCFYEDILGLLRTRDDVETTYESSDAARQMFDLQPGERFLVTAFDDPRSSKSDLQAVRSGRLYILRFPEAMQLADCFEKAKPGCLGMSLYTYRVKELEEYFNRVKVSAARSVTEITGNEFGETSFSFVAPDGYFWTLIGFKGVWGVG
ncbi:VOC family protein [Coleofasciculus sp. LEGE 07081]|uniref:VOC family protein n=1 Tax=unclassified Coleofasciculus TaxID=2692782 RepID=UPI001881FB09|nr:VOC family protein [Coleofasciculus sp. LEGE 07081]MBE9128079.1 VOC family protein [Coleofasciculus sp. LEGE 07081]MBE9146952.1 VOC family protein [Coleofasciculus sp. LEGE 07092]